MKQKTISLFLLLVGILAHAQRDYLRIDLNSKTSLNAIVNLHLVEDKISKSLYAFAEEQKVTYGFKFNIDKTLESELVSKGLKRKYKEIIGHIIDGNKVRQARYND